MSFLLKYNTPKLLLCSIFLIFLNSCDPEEVPETAKEMNSEAPIDKNIKDPIIIKPLTGNEHDPNDDRGEEPDPEEPII